jgi:hypothetical protein
MRSLHITLGAALTLVLGFRVLWRMTGARRPDFENDCSSGSPVRRTTCFTFFPV